MAWFGKHSIQWKISFTWNGKSRDRQRGQFFLRLGTGLALEIDAAVPATKDTGQIDLLFADVANIP